MRRAGDYPYERELTLHKAITMAGGFTDKAATSRAKVIRKIEGKEQEISLDLEGIILPEDIIVVPRSFFQQDALSASETYRPVKFCCAEMVAWSMGFLNFPLTVRFPHSPYLPPVTSQSLPLLLRFSF
jgi:hypothetical protein